MKTSLVEIDKLIQKGELETALERLSSVGSSKLFVKSILKSKILQLKGIYHQSQDILSNFINDLDKNHGLDYIEAKLIHSYNLMRFGEYIPVLTELSSLRDFVLNFEYCDETERNSIIGRYYNIIAIVYHYQGEFEPAITNYHKSLEARLLADNKEALATTYNNMGLIHRQRGNIIRAEELFLKSLETYNDLNESSGQDYALNNMGKINFEKGKYEEALDYMYQSLKIREKGTDQIALSFTLFELIKVNIALENLTDAEKYFQQLETLNDNPQIDFRRRLADALISKNKDRMRDIIYAQGILEKLSNEEIIDHEYTIYAILNLADLLLFELKITNTLSILTEIKELIYKLLDIAKTQNSTLVFIEAQIILAKILFVEGDIETANSIFNNSLELAEINNLRRLANQISREHTIIIQNSRKLSLVDPQASLKNRIELLKLDESLKLMILPEILEEKFDQEVPLLLLIIKEGGITSYSYQFNTREKMTENLISSFLSAMDSFSFELFGSAMDQIQIKDKMVVMKQSEDLSFYYVHQGDAYQPLRKINSLILQIKKNKLLWKDLKTKRGTMLSDDDKLKIDEMVEHIFFVDTEI